jgi:hypothetical protein
VLRVLRPLLRRVVVVAPRQVLRVLHPLLRRVVVIVAPRQVLLH